VIDSTHRTLTRGDSRTQERVAEIVRAATERSESFTYQGWSGVLTGVAIALIGVALFVASYRVGSPVGFGIAAIALVWAVRLWMRLVPLFSKPMLSLSKEGVDTAWYGFIPWTAVEGVHASRGSRSVENALELLVPTLPTMVAQLHPFVRALQRMAWSRRSREVLQFPIRAGGRRLEVVSGVAEALWEKRIGRRKIWFPDDPSLNERLQTAERESRRLMDISAGTSDPQAALAAMQKANAALDDHQRWYVERNRRDRKLAVVVLVIMIAVIVAMIYFGVATL